MTARQEPSSTIVVVIRDADCVDNRGLCERVGSLLKASDADIGILDVAAIASPDVGTVDALARILLTARRLGRDVRLRHASSDLTELLALAGLRDVVGCRPDSGLQPGRQSEEREHARGVEERGDPGDPIL